MSGPSSAVAGPSTTRDRSQRNGTTRIGGQDRHAPSTDATPPHVPELKKKGRGAKAEPPVLVQQITCQNVTGLPFDARSIIPNTKPQKNLPKLLEASSSLNKLPDSRQISFECIDGFTRTYDQHSNLLTSEVHVDDMINRERASIQSTSTSETSTEREQFKAFGIEAYPTLAVFNDLCYDFVSTQRWCPHGSHCYRIHPLNKQVFLPEVIKDSVKINRMKSTNLPSRRNALDIPTHEQSDMTSSSGEQNAANTPPTATVPVAEPPILVKLPPAVPSTASSSSNSLPKFVSNRASTSKPEVPPRHRPTQSLSKHPSQTFVDDVQNWDTGRGLKDNRWNNHRMPDTSRGSNDSDDDTNGYVMKNGSVVYPYPGEARFWEVNVDESAWSDSNVTADDLPSVRVKGGREASVATGADTSSSNPPSFTKMPASGEKAPAAVHRTVRHPRPRNSERCRKWLRDQCDRGYRCHFVHEDLEYDDEPEPLKTTAPAPGAQDPLKGAILAHLTSTPERFLVRRPPDKFEAFGSTLYTHIQLKFGAGFKIAEITTGFESPWIFVGGLPRDISEPKLQRMLAPFGEVLETRRSANLTSPLTVKVHFAKASDAFNAFINLHDAEQFGGKLEVRMAVENKNNGTIFRNTAVRIDWDAPCRNVYMGYTDLERAEKAVERARYIPYGDYMAIATLHYDLPAVGRVTVKFRGLPVDVTADGMKIFGDHEGMVTERPNYERVTLEDTINGVKRMLSQYRSKMVDFEVRPPPYKEGKMRAWAMFSSPKDAEQVAGYLHNRKPASMGYTRVLARHIKSISFSVSVVKFRRVATEVRALAEKVWRQGGGYSVSVIDKNSFFNVRLCGEDLKILGRLKSELERVLNGEPVQENSKVVWDDFFGRQSGIEFLQDLERQFPDVSVDRVLSRRTIRLFGVAEKRAVVRRKIIDKVTERRLRSSYVIPLPGDLADALSKDHEDGFKAIEKVLGEGNVTLDLWQHQLVVNGDQDAFTTANDSLNVFRQKHQIYHPRQRTGDVCPACINEASSPVKLPCGHSWCRTCLQRYLKVAIEKQTIFPLTCHGIDKRCGEGIPLLVAREMLAVSDFDALVEAAFSAHIQAHLEEFHFCPTPDCHQVYRSTPEGIFMQCPECLGRVCTSCHAEAHDGLTCTESRDGDDLFRDWAGKHDVKQCPSCKIAIEKEEGCNHMVCTMCKTHICWVCLQTFPNGNGIYGHMRSAHGSWGLGPIV